MPHGLLGAGISQAALAWVAMEEEKWGNASGQEMEILISIRIQCSFSTLSCSKILFSLFSPSFCPKHLREKKSLSLGWSQRLLPPSPLPGLRSLAMSPAGGRCASPSQTLVLIGKFFWASDNGLSSASLRESHLPPGYSPDDMTSWMLPFPS